jgi:hypothetical protein
MPQKPAAKHDKGTKMTILATVSFGGNHFTAWWEFVDSKPIPYLVINKDEDGNLFIIKLDPKAVRDGSEDKKIYAGTADSARGQVLKKG